MTKWKSNKDKVRGNIAAGGWDVSYGREVTSLDLVVGALSTVTGGVGTAAWVELQIAAQLKKFGQSLANVPGNVKDQVTNILKDAISKGKKGTWDIGGLGVKAGVATYDHWFKLGIGGWQKSAPSFQPFIAFRLAKQLATAGVLELAETEPPVLLATALLDMEESEPEPPPSPIATHEDIHWVYGKEEPLPNIVMAG
ncbi:hypothetical protein H634G_09975 [Metarhizium anisopliae BRIP 53293]|uniref:Carbohydrate-binding module family 13 protein n=1 Tax=Metarhizium anisopliae BRIP 53293 TaxID=1291518 RepID=A0A0D9NL51_METAN|nr:hypothetical protein H634G_09975 [Metarhizium anisopliae BRIP 53293]KJK87333.1 hypothetical protein H633G_08815 [Metarhizium anisopliae BRIP 53284]